MNNDMIVLTPSALLAFLSQIEELSDLPLEMEELTDGISVKIGEATYTLEAKDDSVIEVEDEVVDELDAINEEGYEEITDEYTDNESVEGGIIKELIKTLAVGGLVRLTKSAIANS